MNIFQSLVAFFQFLFHWAPSPLNWIFAALVGLANFIILKKIVAFILDMIPFM